MKTSDVTTRELDLRVAIEESASYRDVHPQEAINGSYIHNLEMIQRMESCL